MSKKSICNIEDVEGLGDNPLLDGFYVIVNDVVETRMMYDVGDVKDGVLMNVGESRVFSFMLERASYSKVFKNAVNRRVLMSMRGSSVKMYLWLIYCVKSGLDYVMVNVELLKKDCGFNHNTYRSSVKQLGELGVVAETKYANVFWINPSYFFCGNRLKKYADKVVRERKGKITS